jgi:hypothetical protein
MSRSTRTDRPPEVTPSSASRGPLYRAAPQDVSVKSRRRRLCLGMLGGAAESQRLAVAVLGSAPVHGGAVAGEDRGPLEYRREVRDAANTSPALSHVDIRERAAERTLDFFNFLEAHHGLVPRFRLPRLFRPLVLPKMSSISPMVRSLLVASRNGR